MTAVTLYRIDPVRNMRRFYSLDVQPGPSGPNFNRFRGLCALPDGVPQTVIEHLPLLMQTDAP
jgi:hypothetical protein